MGSRAEGARERPKAVSEYLVERLIAGGARKICFVIAPGKADILSYYGGSALDSAQFAFVVQPKPAGLCDAVFRTIPLVHPDESVCIGLPDTVWFPEDALQSLGSRGIQFLLFPVEHPEFFDAVITDEADRVLEIRVKQRNPGTQWIWGAFKMPGQTFHGIHQLWLERNKRDEYFGTLVNAWMEAGGDAYGVRAGESYVDVGTLHGYREAIRVLSQKAEQVFQVVPG